MSQFINARTAVVTVSMDGMLRASGGQFARFAVYPRIRVVIRSDWWRE